MLDIPDNRWDSWDPRQWLTDNHREVHPGLVGSWPYKEESREVHSSSHPAGLRNRDHGNRLLNEIYQFIYQLSLHITILIYRLKVLLFSDILVYSQHVVVGRRTAKHCDTSQQVFVFLFLSSGFERSTQREYQIHTQVHAYVCICKHSVLTFSFRH